MSFIRLRLLVLSALAGLAWTPPAAACSYAPGPDPVLREVPANGWVWVFAADAVDLADHVRLEGPDGAVAVEVAEVLPRSEGRPIVGLRPVNGPLAADADYFLVDDRAPEYTPIVHTVAAVEDSAPPPTAGFDGGYVLWSGGDSCLSGGLGVAYACIGHVGSAGDAAPLLEGRLVDDVTGDVIDSSLARGQLRLDDAGRDDVDGITVEVRSVGPTGERGEVWSAPLRDLAGYRDEEEGHSPPVLRCEGGVLADTDGPVAEVPRYVSLGSGGCAVGGGGAFSPWLAGLVLAGWLWWRRRGFA